MAAASEENCHQYEARFTGQAIPARRGLTAVSVRIQTDGSRSVWRQEVHAWGTYRSTMIHNREEVGECPVCRASIDHPDFFLRPMTLNNDGGYALSNPDDDLSEWRGDSFLGVFEDETGMEEAIEDAVQRGHAKWETWQAELRAKRKQR